MEHIKGLQSALPSSAILIYRLGDFYEMFFDDAKTGAEVLGLTVTRRSGVPMAGFSVHAKDSNIKKLIEAEKSFAIAKNDKRGISNSITIYEAYSATTQPKPINTNEQKRNSRKTA